MKILQSSVNWYPGYVNSPTIQVLSNKIPLHSDLKYEYKNGLYYAELDGYVHFLFKKGDRQEDGFGGHHYHITMKSGEEKVLKGPWSSRAGCANMLGFTPCCDVSITDDPLVFERGYTFFGGAITVEKMIEASVLAGVYLVKIYDKNNSLNWIPDIGGDQANALHMGVRNTVIPFDVEIPPHIEYTVVPSMSPDKLVKKE